MVPKGSKKQFQSERHVREVLTYLTSVLHEAFNYLFPFACERRAAEGRPHWPPLSMLILASSFHTQWLLLTLSSDSFPHQVITILKRLLFFTRLAAWPYSKYILGTPLAGLKTRPLSNSQRFFMNIKNSTHRKRVGLDHSGIIFGGSPPPPLFFV